MFHTTLAARSGIAAVGGRAGRWIGGQGASEEAAGPASGAWGHMQGPRGPPAARWGGRALHASTHQSSHSLDAALVSVA